MGKTPQKPRYSKIDPRRLGRWVVQPALLILIALAVHAAGRFAAVCAPARFDSFVYAVAACKFYDPAATFEDLVPDKPPGQALLTGWCYRLWPGAPTRLTLLPVESAFLLSGFLIFALLTARKFGWTVAAAATLLLVLGINTYNTLDTTVAGLNVNENYMLLPMMLAVYAHLAIGRPGVRGLWRGVGIGLALTIKQTAVGLLAVLVIHGLIRSWRKGQGRAGLISAGATVLGMGLAWLPLVAYLAYRGWLGPHLRDLLDLSGGHAGLMAVHLPPTFKLVPLAALAWWIAVGLFVRLDRAESKETSDRAGGVAWFAWLWLAAEVLLVWSLTKRSAHYYQLLVPPAALLAAVGMVRFTGAMAAGTLRRRQRMRGWAAAVTVALLLVTTMPLASSLRLRAGDFDYAHEVRAFAHWLEHWSARSLRGSYTPPEPPFDLGQAQ